jgi:hypothetical protein
MDRVEFSKGDILMKQGDPQDRCARAKQLSGGAIYLSRFGIGRAFFIANGQIRRERLVNDRSHQVVCLHYIQKLAATAVNINIVGGYFRKYRPRSVWKQENRYWCSSCFETGK